MRSRESGMKRAKRRRPYRTLTKIVTWTIRKRAAQIAANVLHHNALLRELTK